MQRKFAISDIHGCFRTFQILIEEKLKIEKDDVLYLLGDYLDKGPKQFSLINYIIDMQESGYQIHTIAGNHEMLLLNQFYKKERIVNPEMIEVIENMPIMLNYSNFIFIHYFNYLKYRNIPKNAKEFTQMNFSDIFDKIPDERIENKTVIYGHMITQLSTIVQAVNQRKQFIPIDNGCSQRGVSGTGNLIAYEFENNKIYLQKNID